jgi:hypothetical protein
MGGIGSGAQIGAAPSGMKPAAPRHQDNEPAAPALTERRSALKKTDT